MMVKRKPEDTVSFPCKRSKATAPSTIESLPQDLLIEIMARVASSSFVDLQNTKRTHRDFLRAADEDYILQRVCLEFETLLWKLTTSPEGVSFLKRCLECGNAECLYWQGMMDFFSLRDEASGMENLHAAAEKGHLEASYVYGLILHLTSKEEGAGLQFLKGCEAKAGRLRMKECRKRITRFMSRIWIVNKIVPANSGCQIRCCKIAPRRGWPDEDDDYDYDDIGEAVCESCRWNLEAARFCNMLKTGSYKRYS